MPLHERTLLKLNERINVVDRSALEYLWRLQLVGATGRGWSLIEGALECP